MTIRDVEKAAILAAKDSERMKVIRLVSDFRQYRALTQQMLAKRYRNGELDGTTLSVFASVVQELEERND